MGIVDDFLGSQKGRVILSIIWGLGLAALFRKVCKGRNCIVLKAPDTNSIKDKIYRFDNKCYKFNPQATSCKKHKNILE